MPMSATRPSKSQRAQLRATDELVPQALSGYRPTVEAGADAGYSRSRTRAGDQVRDHQIQQRGLDLSVVQPLYSGGRTQAGTKRAEALVEAQRADLLSTEQTVLLDGATAYLDVVRDQAVVDLNVNNEQVLRRQLDASRDRFNVGEITRTDVSQAESRLARALSDRIEAEGQLSASRAVYARVIGSPPGRLTAPRLVFDLPSSRKKPWRWPRATIRTSSRRNIRKRRLATPSMPSGARCCHPLTSAARCRAPTIPVPRADRRRRVGHGVRDDPAVSGRLHRSRVREARQTAGQRRIQIEVAPSGGRERDSRLGRSDDRPRHHRVAAVSGPLLGNSAGRCPPGSAGRVAPRWTPWTASRNCSTPASSLFRRNATKWSRHSPCCRLPASFRPGSLACGFRSTTMKSITSRCATSGGAPISMSDNAVPGRLAQRLGSNLTCGAIGSGFPIRPLGLR